MTGTMSSDPGPQPESAPGVMQQAHAWVLERWPATIRRRVALVAVLVAVGFIAISTTAKLVGVAIDAGLLGYVGLMVVCWVGAGGALVPVPGVRPLSWIMIVHQSAVLFAPIVALVAALAMALGQASYFLTARAEARRQQEGRAHLRLGSRERDLGSDEDQAPDDVETETSPDAGTRGTKSSNPIVARSRTLLADGKAAVARRMVTHPQRILFALCVVPNPLTTFATVSAASTGLPFERFFAASLAGFLVLTTALAIAGQGLLVALGLG